MIDTTEAAYRLTYQPDGTSITVRENLVDILARELLGPIRGPQEVLPFSPRSQYLVGHLAPVKLTGAALIDDNAVQARANAEALAEGGGVPALRGRRNDADTDDDAQDRAPKQGLMIPASMGLRFQVPPDLVSFTITASWITYETVESGR